MIECSEKFRLQTSASHLIKAVLWSKSHNISDSHRSIKQGSSHPAEPIYLEAGKDKQPHLHFTARMSVECSGGWGKEARLPGEKHSYASISCKLPEEISEERHLNFQSCSHFKCVVYFVSY